MEEKRIADEQARIALEQEQQQAQTAAVETGQGLIKGSENGIYHTPGSTYYDRTTNVVQWFNTIEEAVAAGYRAPKR
ncbi:Prophage Lp1 protein 65 (fragment) [Carnobacterium maltaromaticum]